VPIETPVYVDRTRLIGQTGTNASRDDYEYLSKLERLGSVEVELRALAQDN